MKGNRRTEGSLEMIAPEEITPLHEVRSDRLLASLSKDMEENGWQGRPLLVIEREADYLAWTGSHRIAAARRVGLATIPCYVLSEDALMGLGVEADRGHVEDWERLEIITKTGDETAIHIMWQEGRS